MMPLGSKLAPPPGGGGEHDTSLKHRDKKGKCQKFSSLKLDGAEV